MHKSTPANFSLPRDGYIRFWRPEDALSMPGEKLSAAAFMQDGLTIMEIKGQMTGPFTVELPVAENRYWLVFQFIGTFLPPGGAPLEAGYYGLFQPGIGTKSFRFDTKHKIWALMLGIPDNGLDAMQIEWPLSFAGDGPAAVSSSHQQGLPIGYRQQEVLKKLQQLHQKPYSTAIKLQNALVEFMNILQADLQDAEKSTNLQQVALYHRAVEYIRKHYMDAGLSRDGIAEALYVSVRTLTRAFEGKSNNVISTIRMVRLHRARELLRGTDMTLEDIAFELHFADAKHLSKMYQKLFGRSPANDRREFPLLNDEN
ncbi:Helix-turn-helix domain-containing protein [bacterium A37T11]|nr:Helix-turn-helix domain-containing protein [bacterium A37T11]